MGVLDRFRLDGRVALVTGGGRGLGRSIAEALASAGAAVALSARSLDAAEGAARGVAEATGSRALGVAMEVTDEASVAAAVGSVVANLGRLDILINNAGINIRRPIEELAPSEWDDVIDANLKGAWLCCRAASPELRARGWGRVVNVSSMLADVAMPGRTPYASSKAGLSMLTKVLALEWARSGVNVNALAPGPFATEMNRPLLADPEARAFMESRVPLGRWGDPAEIGPAVLFLASDASSFMTGATLTLDGGYTAQ